jgi:hypothetical protein
MHKELARGLELGSRCVTKFVRKGMAKTLFPVNHADSSGSIPRKRQPYDSESPDSNSILLVDTIVSLPVTNSSVAGV